MIDFGCLPPEINSGRMYAGMGAGPLLAAAAGWQALAAGLLAAGGGMAGITAALVSGPWTGPSSMMMGMSHAQFLEWVFATAATAEKAAAAAMGAVDVYGTAFAATIPPPEVERNQITTATLIATNFLGVNSAAIAASQAEYQEYWAQDASAMYAYAASNMTIAASLNAPPFLPAIPDTDPAGLGAQAAAVGESAAQAPGQAASTVSGATSQLSGMGSGLSSLGSAVSAPAQAMGQIPQALGQLASPLGSMMSPMASMFGSAASPLGGVLGGFSGVMSGAGGAAGNFGPFGSVASVNGFGGNGIMAGMGQARSLPGGRLSVPAGWAGSTEYTTNARPLANSAVSAAPIMSEQPETYGSGGGSPRMGVMPPLGAMGSGGGAGSTVHYGSPVKIAKRPVF
jgi:PPE-repeat protein